MNNTAATPEIKRYTKKELRYILNAGKDKPFSSGKLFRQLKPYFESLNIVSVPHYNSLREFTPSQVKIIFEVLL